MRRVVITGIGAVSPNGIGRERFWEATRNGVSGVSRITRFDPSAYQVQVAGQVSDEFDEKKYVEIKDRPHVSRAVPLAAASVAEAVADAGLDVSAMSRDELRGIGVIVGSGGGSQDFTEEQYRLYYAGLIKQCSVYTIPTGTIGTLGERSLDALRVSRIEPHRVHGVHIFDRRDGVRLPEYSDGRAGHDGDGRRGFADRAADPARFPVDADHVDELEQGAFAGFASVL